MFERLLGDSSLLDLPIWAMVFFIAVFAAVLGRVLSGRGGAGYARMAQLPFDDGEERAS